MDCSVVSSGHQRRHVERFSDDSTAAVDRFEGYNEASVKIPSGHALAKPDEVLTTPKKFDRPKTPVWHARFIRRNAASTRAKNQNCSQLFDRARYYDTSTGEFSSRDPLEYVDGMSMMRGYMELGAQDPNGNDTVTEFFSDPDCCKDTAGNNCVVKIADSVAEACARIRKTLEGLQKYRDVLRDQYKNPGLVLGGLAALYDSDYQKVIDNFDRAAECCSTAIKIDCRYQKSKCRDGETALYTWMNRFTYKATSNIYVCPLFCDGSERNRTKDMAYEIGRFCGMQYEQSTGDPIWDVYRWDSYIDSFNSKFNLDAWDEALKKRR